MSTHQEFVLVEEHGEKVVIRLPNENEWLMPDIKWGNRNRPFTPAFWASSYWTNKIEGTLPKIEKAPDLIEEVAFCVLGGYGIKAELNKAAYDRVQQLGFLRAGREATLDEIQEALSQPFSVGGRDIRYRFPRLKGRYLFEAIEQLHARTALPTDPIDTRNWLLTFKGIGPKTASWVVRNLFHTDQVAILDIHLHRAGVLLGLFKESDSVSKHYFRMEEKFLTFAANLKISSSVLDLLIWNVMRENPRTVKNAFLERN